MRALVINLDRAPERLAHVTATFAAAGVNFERFAAVDGRKLSAEEIARRRQGTAHFYQLGPSELACFLSHRACWAIVAAADEPMAIFEDDIHLSSTAGGLLGSADWVPKDADIVKLDSTLTKTGFDRRPTATVDGRRITRLRGRHTGGAGYILTPAGADKLLASLENISDPFDQLVFNPAFPTYRLLTIYQAVPALCIQDDILFHGGPGVTLNSYLESERRLPRRTGLAKVWREIERPFGQLAEKIREVAINTASSRKWMVVPFE